MKYLILALMTLGLATASLASIDCSKITEENAVHVEAGLDLSIKVIRNSNLDDYTKSSAILLILDEKIELAECRLNSLFKCDKTSGQEEIASLVSSVKKMNDQKNLQDSKDKKVAGSLKADLKNNKADYEKYLQGENLPEIIVKDLK